MIVSILPQATVSEAVAVPITSRVRATPHAAVAATKPLAPLPNQALMLASRLTVDSARVLVFAGAENVTITGQLTADIGRALVQLGQGPVLLLETDGKARSLEAYLGITSGPGLLGELHGDLATIEDRLHPVGAGLSAMGWGTDAERNDFAHPLATPELETFLARMRRAFSWVLISGPEPTRAINTALVARHVDRIVVAVGRGKQSRSRLDSLRRTLTEAKLPPVSIVLV